MNLHPRITKHLLLFLAFIIAQAVAAINADSLRRVINKTTRDTHQVNAMNILGDELLHTNPSECYLLSHKARALAELLDFKKGIGEADQTLGMYFSFNGGDSALYYLNKAKIIFTQIKSERRLGSISVTLGTYYETISDFQNSLDNYLGGLKIFEKLKSDKGIAGASLGLGNVFFSLNNFKKSIEYSRKSMTHYQKINSPYVSWAMNNMANAYEKLGIMDTAVALYEQSLALKLENKDYYGAVFSIENLGNIYLQQGDLKKALTYFERMIAVCRQRKLEKEPFANAFKSLAEVYLRMENYSRAKQNLDSVNVYMKALNFGELQTDYFHKMSRYFEGINDYKQACEYKDRYIKIKDSLFTSEVNRIVTEADTKYTTEKKQKEIELLNKDKKISALQLQESDAKLNKQRVIIFSAAGAAILLIVMVIMLINRNKLKQKTNEKLSAFNYDLQTQKNLVEEKQKEILDSIHYAKRIQQSLLTNEKYIHKTLNKLKK